MCKRERKAWRKHGLKMVVSFPFHYVISTYFHLLHPRDPIIIFHFLYLFLLISVVCKQMEHVIASYLRKSWIKMICYSKVNMDSGRDIHVKVKYSKRPLIRHLWGSYVAGLPKMPDYRAS
jgi:hypothetical protein